MILKHCWVHFLCTSGLHFGKYYLQINACNDICFVMFLSPSSYRVSVAELREQHVISYELEKDLLPLVLSNCQYSLERGHETITQYDLPMIQQQIITRFLQGKPLITRTVSSHSLYWLRQIDGLVKTGGLSANISHDVWLDVLPHIVNHNVFCSNVHMVDTWFWTHKCKTIITHRVTLDALCPHWIHLLFTSVISSKKHLPCVCMLPIIQLRFEIRIEKSTFRKINNCNWCISKKTINGHTSLTSPLQPIVAWIVHNLRGTDSSTPRKSQTDTDSLTGHTFFWLGLL